MKNFTFAISPVHLRTAATFAAVRHVRSYLCGVHVDCANGRIVATDGAALITIDEAQLCDGTGPAIIPLEMLTKHVRPRGPVVNVTLSDWDAVAERYRTVALSQGSSGTVVSPTLDGRFPPVDFALPNIPAVVPRYMDIRRVDITLVARMVDALRALELVGRDDPKIPAYVGVYDAGAKFESIDMPKTKGVRIKVMGLRRHDLDEAGV